MSSDTESKVWWVIDLMSPECTCHGPTFARRYFPDASDFIPQTMGDCWQFRATPVDNLPGCFGRLAPGLVPAQYRP